MNPVENDGARLTQDQLVVLEGLLLGKRAELVEILDSLNQQITARADCSFTDAVDAAGLQETRIRATGLAMQHRQLLEEIDHALGRLNRGSYGISETSGEAIPFERLLLVPWARSDTEK